MSRDRSMSHCGDIVAIVKTFSPPRDIPLMPKKNFITDLSNLIVE